MRQPSNSYSRFLGYANDYRARIREFSRNANLYVLHVIGMDMIHGSLTVLFNLYLLAIGFDLKFVGARLVVGFIASALTAAPAGLLADRLGRKTSFILGDGIGALILVVMIHTLSEPILLGGAALGGLFGNLHRTSEAAFMMENSKPRERVHLVSVASSARTMSAMAGALMAGLVPALFIDDLGAVTAYRYATYAGISLWIFSLVPALKLRSLEAEERPETAQLPGYAPTRRALGALFSGIQHPRRIAYFVLTSTFIAFGSAAVVSLMNVVFHEGQIQADEGEIGMMFAAGELALAIATLGVPLLASRMLKVDAIAVTRVLSLPFILGLAFVPSLLNPSTQLVLLAGLLHMGRVTILRMSRPLDDAFNMEVLDARKRATNTGIELAAGAAVSGVAVLVGSRLMDSGDFTTPFLMLAFGYLVSTVIYWRVFRPLETSGVMQGERPASLARVE